MELNINETATDAEENASTYMWGRPNNGGCGVPGGNNGGYNPNPAPGCGSGSDSSTGSGSDSSDSFVDSLS
jgi:hypothetical protein